MEKVSNKLSKIKKENNLKIKKELCKFIDSHDLDEYDDSIIKEFMINNIPNLKKIFDL